MSENTAQAESDQPNRKKVAILGGKGLGDNLIEMVLAENARLAGWQADMFSSVLQPLARWFPHHDLYPSLHSEELSETLQQYDQILEPKPPPHPVCPEVSHRWLAYESLYRDDRTQVENMMAISQQVFAVSRPYPENGIAPPQRLGFRCHDKRVCIHPTSAEISKNWLPQRFLQLAQRLTEASYEVCFIMSAAEVPQWQAVIAETFPLQGFSSLEDCAAFIYESGYFIGNDSGGGHLASCLGIPTLSLHGRKRKAVRWQPGWGEVEVITPKINMIGGCFRQRYWKYLMPVGAVERGFMRLAHRTL